MSFFSKLLYFFKHFHPIKSFAKPMPQRFGSQTTTMASTFASVPISYEALKAEVVETPHVSEYQETKEYTLDHHFQTFAPETIKEEHELEMNGEDVETPVVVIRKLEVRPEESLVLEQTVEAPLAPDTVISDIVDLSQFQTEAEIQEETSTSTVTLLEDSSVPPPSKEESFAEPITVEVKKKARIAKKPEPKAPKKSPKAPASASAKAKTSVKKAAKTTRSTSSGQAIKKTTSRKKVPTPKEAMGFGF